MIELDSLENLGDTEKWIVDFCAVEFRPRSSFKSWGYKRLASDRGQKRFGTNIIRGAS